VQELVQELVQESLPWPMSRKNGEIINLMRITLDPKQNYDLAKKSYLGFVLLNLLEFGFFLRCSFFGSLRKVKTKFH
jgi:hypothetical protein